MSINLYSSSSPARIIWRISMLLGSLILLWMTGNEWSRYHNKPQLNTADSAVAPAVLDVRVGWCDSKGTVVDKNYVSDAVAVTVYIHKLDDWLRDVVLRDLRVLGVGITAAEIAEFDELRRKEAALPGPVAALTVGAAATTGGAKRETSETAPKSAPTTTLPELTSAEIAQLATLRDKIESWINGKRQSLCLVLAGRTFPSMRVFDITSPQRSTTESNQLTRAVFNLAPPVATATNKEEVEKWHSVIRAVGANCEAQITVATLLPGNVGEIQMPTLVNSDTAESGTGTVVNRELPLVPGIRRGMAAVAVLVSLAMVLAAAIGTDALRDGRSAAFANLKPGAMAPWSLARVVFGWWLAICSASFVYIWAVTGEHSHTLSTTVPLLLGISGATFLVTAGFGRGVGASTASINRLPLPSKGFFSDLISEAGEPEVSRLQMMVWNAVLGVVFLWQTVFQWKMPEFDTTIMTLLGISSTAYAGFKFMPGSGAPRPDGQGSSVSSPSSAGSVHGAPPAILPGASGNGGGATLPSTS